MIKIKIQLDFNNGPIWGNYYDEELNRTMTGIDKIDNNDEIQKLNNIIQDKYSSYYEFNSHDQACWFNEDKQKALDLIKNRRFEIKIKKKQKKKKC